VRFDARPVSRGPARLGKRTGEARSGNGAEPAAEDAALQSSVGNSAAAVSFPNWQASELAIAGRASGPGPRRPPAPKVGATPGTKPRRGCCAFKAEWICHDALSFKASTFRSGLFPFQWS
jgi:hypothetical protein